MEDFESEIRNLSLTISVRDGMLTVSLYWNGMYITEDSISTRELELGNEQGT